MASKKYFWLRLKRDFFKRHDIRIIESMPNGKDYILFYLKLLCESVDHEGNLRFSNEIPYSDEMLAVITNTNIDIVRAAVKIFCELNMMDILDDGTFYMSEVEKLIGCETVWAEKKREYREKQKLLADNVGHCPPVVRQEKEIEKEKELDIYTTLSKDKVELPITIPYQEIVDEYNKTCTNLPAVKMLSDKRKKAIKKIYENKDIGRAGISMAFNRVRESDFLNGKNNHGWKASFDWLMNSTNIIKVLEGNYDNKTKTDYERLARWAGEGNE